jgi:23S rRNA (uridine2552-2'-O)-methyltransferase
LKRSRPKHHQWQDHYTRKARAANYPARSVFKLEALQKKFSLLKKGGRVLDLGCAPGSWLLFAARTVGHGGAVVGVDLKPLTLSLPPNVTVITGDLLNLTDDLSERIGRGYQAVISDMAPATTGHKGVDSLRSLVLCEAALALALERLEIGGNFACKIFQGGDFKSFLEEVRRKFDFCKAYKPAATRKASRETYVIGLGRKQEDHHVGSQQMVDHQA